MERELVITWIYKALDLDLEDKIYIPGESKPTCQTDVKQFNKELTLLFRLSPEKTGTVTASYSFKDSRHWVVLKRTLGNPLVGFVKKAGGELDKVTLKHDPEREERLKLMQKDRLSLKEAESLEGPLSLEEKEMFV